MFERQGRSLIDEGYRVSYIVCDLLPNEINCGVEIISTGYVAKTRLDRFINTKKILYNIAKKTNADIYQISDPELISLGIKLKRRGKKVVFNMRENYPAILKNKYYLPKIVRKPFSFFFEIYMKRLLRKYDAIFLVTSDLVQLSLNRWKIKKSYLLTNFPIVNTNYFLTFDDYNQRENVLCYIGTVYEVSRQENVFMALEHLHDAHYLIAGIIDEGLTKSITSLPYWKNVEFINGFKKSELPDIFGKAIISNVLRDFKDSGTPNGSLGVIKMFESMEAALPIICSDVPLNREIIEKWNCGICVNPNNVNEIEVAIRYLIENKKKAYQMGQNGRQAIIEEYNWKSQAKSYIEVLNKI
jgi:glycosyltransferase involved in cell wall biosynthesis